MWAESAWEHYASEISNWKLPSVNKSAVIAYIAPGHLQFFKCCMPRLSVQHPKNWKRLIEKREWPGDEASDYPHKC